MSRLPATWKVAYVLFGLSVVVAVIWAGVSVD